MWLALTAPDLVKRWQYGSDPVTTWNVGTSIVFRNEWNGHTYEQTGTVLEFSPESRLKHSLLAPRSDSQDVPERCILMTHELAEKGGKTSLLVRHEDPSPSLPDESFGGDDGPDVLADLKKLVEASME